MATRSTKHQIINHYWRKQVFIALFLGLILTLVALILIFLGQTNSKDKLVFDGVKVNGYDLSGMSIEEMAVFVSQMDSFPSTGRVLLNYQDKSWLVSPNEMGFQIDAIATAKKAYQYGRDGSFLKNAKLKSLARNEGVDLSPVYYFDQEIAYEFLSSISSEINVPVIEASLSVQGADVVVNSGQVGKMLDIKSSLLSLEEVLYTLQDGLVTLSVKETEPIILDAFEAADQAEIILRKPLTLRLPETFTDKGPWTISPQELAKLLVIEKISENGRYTFRVSLDKDALIVYLSSLAPTLKTEPVNSRYIFNDDTRELEVIEPAVIGRTLNIENSLRNIIDGTLSGKHEVTLWMDIKEPAAKDDTKGNDLGITELVIARTSYFYGSDPARVQNIKAAAKSFHGLLIAPGETFSMASALTNISLENGYAEALIIVGNQTIKGIGGGVCQVSTTLFRTAFFGGFPIDERHPHAYRVGYYEQRPNGTKDPSLAGLDATVYVPLVDFKFTNDTPYWLLMETYLGNYSLTWKFYSTKDGRSVDWTTTGATNIVQAPDPLYRENPELAQGEIKQIDYAADGAYVNVHRMVYKNGTLYFQDNFITQYQPWQAIFEYGPGTEGIPTPTPKE